MSNQTFRDKSSDLRVAALLLIGLVAVFGGLYAAAYLFTSERVPSRTTVAGVQIGGLRLAAAERKVSDELGPRARLPVVVSAAGRRATIDPLEAGLRLDTAGSVAQAGVGRSWDPRRMWDYVAGGDSYEAVFTVDADRLRSAIAPLARRVSLPVREGRVSFKNGRPEPVLARPGLRIDRAAAARAITRSFLSGPPGGDMEVVPLPDRQVEPQITDADVREAMDEFANPAMAAPVVIEFDGVPVPLRPEAYSSALSMGARDGRLVPVLDRRALLRILAPSLDELSSAPREATVEIVGGAPRVVPGRTGVRFERGRITRRFLSLVVADGERRTLAVDPVKHPPEFGAAAARGLGIRRVVSKFTTNYPHADYRNINLGRAAELVDGTVLKPGELFSLNRTVGERTAANGFTKGFIISNGVYEEDFGGGVSQAATTLFNAAFFAGLEDVEHKPHSFYIDRYPVGREATVAWGSVDLRFRNDTPHGILIKADIAPSTFSREGAMNVTIWSTKHWDIEAGVSGRYAFTEPRTRFIDDEGCTPNVGYGGFDVDVYRFFRRPGSEQLVRRERMHTTYTPSDTVICQ